MDFKPNDLVVVTYPSIVAPTVKRGIIQFLRSDAFEQVAGWRKNLIRYCVRFEDGTIDPYVVSTWINKKSSTC